MSAAISCFTCKFFRVESLGLGGEGRERKRGRMEKRERAEREGGERKRGRMEKREREQRGRGGSIEAGYGERENEEWVNDVMMTCEGKGDLTLRSASTLSSDSLPSCPLTSQVLNIRKMVKKDALRAPRALRTFSRRANEAWTEKTRGKMVPTATMAMDVSKEKSKMP
jgi:hypothetical protein